MKKQRLKMGGLTAAAVTAAGVAGAVALGVFWTSANLFETYGWTLFVVLPLVQGFLAVWLTEEVSMQTIGDAVVVASLSLTLTALAMMVLLLEGAICILMAAPLTFPLAWAGAVVAYWLRGVSWMEWSSSGFCSLSVALLTLMAYGESRVLPEPPVFRVATSVEIDAPPEDVWNQVIAVSDLPEPDEWIFQAGIAYPIRARLKGRGAGAERYCIFSTGAFVEPIEVWDAPRLLKFRVESNPPPMEEWTLYGSAHPPHLEGFLESVAGQFKLERLPGNRTRLEGTTWYRHSMWPAF